MANKLALNVIVEAMTCTRVGRTGLPGGSRPSPELPNLLSGPPQGPGPPAVPEHAPLVPVPPTLGFMRHMRCRPLHWFSIVMYSLRPMPMTCTISAACTQG